MDPGTAAVMGIGGLASAGIQHFSAKSQNEASRRWAKYMSDTAHQREVRDLRGAGLNPILSATGGAGASTPTPSQQDESAFAEGLSRTAASALEVKRLQKELDQADADITVKNAMKTKTEAEEELTRATARNVKATHGKIVAESKLDEKGAKAMDATMGGTGPVAKAILGILQGLRGLGGK